MKFVTYNIQYGLGQDNRTDLGRIADAVRSSEIICLQEVERFWKRSGAQDQVATLADALPDHHWVYAANLDVDASFRDETGRLINRRRQFGNMILSKHPILSSRNMPLPKRALIHQHSIQQGLLETVIDHPDGPLRVYTTHLSHLCPQTRLPQVEAILKFIAAAPAEGGAWCGGHPDPSAGWTEGTPPPMPTAAILAGDMNFNHRSAEYDMICGPFTQKYGRLTPPDGWLDAYAALNGDETISSTMNGSDRIDHIFCTPGLESRWTKAEIDTASTGSDHWPLNLE